jgi:hypothetical protein
LVLPVVPRKPKFCSYWIRLDFLGFSRQNLDLSMGYAGKASKSFSRRFFHGAGRRKRDPTVEGARKGRIAHRASLPHFPIFRN